MTGARLAMRAAVVALATIVALPAAAHGLRVFASVEGDTVVVEASFSSGRAPAGGEIRVFDASETMIGTVDVQPGGVTRFALPDGADSGLMIEVETGGHSDYWMLTPDDVARGQEGS